MVISLFEAWQKNHVCFDTQEKVECELWVMLTSARVYYKEEGVPEKKRLERFLADFKALHGEVNCGRACCKNFHARNHGVVCAILERPDLREKLMALENFDVKDCKELVVLLDSTDAPPPVVGGADAPPPALACSVMSPPLSFGCNLTDEQMVRISHLASTNHLFCVSKGEVVDLKPMLRNEKCKPMVVPNIRLVAQFFDVLEYSQRIAWDWKKTMERGGYLVSKNGVPITANTLASALAAIKTHETAKSKKVKGDVEKALLLFDGEMPQGF